MKTRRIRMYNDVQLNEKQTIIDDLMIIEDGLRYDPNSRNCIILECLWTFKELKKRKEDLILDEERTEEEWHEIYGKKKETPNEIQHIIDKEKKLKNNIKIETIIEPIDYNKFKKVRKTYLMKDKNNGLYKIGYSNNPKNREKTLQSEKPNTLMVKVWDDNIEYKLHNLYKDVRVRGEWFQLNPIQVKYICTHF